MWESFSYNLLKNDQWSKDRFKEINHMDLDFYIVTAEDEKEKIELKNRNTYIYIHENDVYSKV